MLIIHLSLNHEEKYVKEIRMNVMSGKDIVDQFSLKRIDVLAIDAEGFDDVVVKSFFKSRVHPSFVRFERLHLKDEVINALHEEFRQRGYECEDCGERDIHCQLVKYII